MNVLFLRHQGTRSRFPHHDDLLGEVNVHEVHPSRHLHVVVAGLAVAEEASPLLLVLLRGGLREEDEGLVEVDPGQRGTVQSADDARDGAESVCEVVVATPPEWDYRW
ncbi:hypothetical protein BV898_03084 [Hypsibius exemplaris]|uniref:Uncharacterized protein n=1 Tax=Hypsibius exemplaris TaxID=2072580 RepID=A0A1W0X6B9_HYPEX|nr:hypothetical protein BV898_03084 [Hypsibius exemplaris]